MNLAEKQKQIADSVNATSKYWPSILALIESAANMGLYNITIYEDFDNKAIEILNNNGFIVSMPNLYTLNINWSGTTGEGE